MTRHIKTCESYKTFRAQQSGSQQNLTAEGGEENASNLVLGKGWSQDPCRRTVTKMIIMGELPLSFVYNKGFRHFCSVAIPQFVMPSRRTIDRDVMELFFEEKGNVEEFDLQQQAAGVSYNRFMDFCSKHELPGLGELHASVTVIRNVVKYVRSSSTRLRTFKQCAEQVNCPKEIVVFDCPTRWNSTYLMLMIALKFQTAFDRMVEVDKPYEAYFAEKENNVRRVGPLGPEDWESAERIVKFLKVFYDATLLFSASLSVTSNLCYNIIDLIESSLTALQESTDSLVSSMAYSMRENFNKKVSVQNESRRVVSEVERYPIMEKIARDVLVVLVSTMASESAFSTGHRIIDEYKSSLTPAMVDALICTENWLQSKLFANPVYNL
ncbi:BED-type domain-containing protein [Citrus sinensis]|nr:BED-type domain-containing protein [Citrus sinensis]